MVKVQLLILTTLPALCWLCAWFLNHSANSSLYPHSKNPLPISEHLNSESNLGSPLKPQNSLLADFVLDDKPNHIFTFAHISDLHLSKFNSAGGVMHLLHFLNSALPFISPRHLFITGDLTDGKDKNKIGSQQYLEEWVAYNNALKNFGLLERDNGEFLFDQRGNHDCFNIPSWNSSLNYYSEYSATKSQGYVLKTNLGYAQYCFVASDACPKAGITRPMNFFGYLTAKDIEKLENQIKSDCKNSDHIFMLNHYPVGITKYGTSISSNFDSLSSHISVYLCGHLHYLLFGLGKNLKYLHSAPNHQFLELELGDLKDNAVYRVYAIDNNIISFADIKLPLPKIPAPNPNKSNPLQTTSVSRVPHPPVIIITNPKDARYTLPKRENLKLIKTSTHIRVLVYSDSPIDSVHVYIDKKLIGKATTKSTYLSVDDRWSTNTYSNYVPLYTVPWDPSLYMDSKSHKISVKAVDIDGKKGSQSFKFRLDELNIPLSNSLSGGRILQTDFTKLLPKLCVLSYIFGFLLLWVPRMYFYFGLGNSTSALVDYYNKNLVSHIVPYSQYLSFDTSSMFIVFKSLATDIWARALFMSSNSIVFWPLFSYSLAITVFPLFVGHLIPSDSSSGIGSMYIYGIYINGSWVPLTDSWMYSLSSIAYPLTVFPLYIVLYSLPMKSPVHWFIKSMNYFQLFYSMVIPLVMSCSVYGTWTVLFSGLGKSWILLYMLSILLVLDLHFSGYSLKQFLQRNPNSLILKTLCLPLVLVSNYIISHFIMLSKYEPLGSLEPQEGLDSIEEIESDSSDPNAFNSVNSSLEQNNQEFLENFDFNPLIPTKNDISNNSYIQNPQHRGSLPKSRSGSVSPRESTPESSLNSPTNETFLGSKKSFNSNKKNKFV
ncbi:hypothetical protein BB560_000277 [Smittium megazygosporum]|uniref:Uncharacterized protein n=1 Tax=Smittium megazygosporum TaxID=133381 RepID=A0A2T9ZKR2_9FUNG|nr:hypothetical protein BB560_000277 [Smittium megazygosporum]